MASGRARFVGEVSVREKRVLSPPEVMRFNINDFEGCRERQIKTPSIQAHGYRWSLFIFPRGNGDESKAVAGYLLLDDLLESGDHVKTKFSLNLGGMKKKYTDIVFTNNSEWNGGFNLIKRSELLNPEKRYLTSDGTLTLEVKLQVYTKVRQVWYPPRRQDTLPMMEELFVSSLHSDISYLVGGREYKAHKNIVTMNAPTLACVEPKNGSANGVEITDIDGDTFETLLRFLYTGRVPTFGESDSKQVESLFMAADRFGCKDLKLLMESTIVDKILNSSNAASWLLHGDSHSCALLKEAAVEKYIQCPDEFVQSDAWPMVTESPRLLLDLLAATRCSQRSDDDIEHMRVSTLRDRLIELGEDVDGSREMLVQRLQSTISSCDSVGGVDGDAAVEDLSASQEDEDEDEDASVGDGI